MHRLGCLRGVGTLTGFALAVEIGDWHRFTGNTIGSFVGLVPSEHSSGASRVQGSITKTGNTHVRRLLVEAAWHHRARYVAGKTMRDRWELAPQRPGPAAMPATGGCTPAGSGSSSAARRPVIANVAVARELAGWCWSLAVLRGVATPPSRLRRPRRGGGSAWSDPRNSYEQPSHRGTATLDSRHADPLLPNSTVLR